MYKSNKIVQPPEKSLAVLIKLNLPHNIEILLLVIYLSEMKSMFRKKLYVNVYIIITESWWTSKWTVKYYSAMKRNKLLIHPTIGRNLECIVLWKKSDSKGYAVYESIHRTFWKRQIYRDRKQISACQGLRVLGGIDYKGSIRIYWSDGILSIF